MFIFFRTIYLSASELIPNYYMVEYIQIIPQFLDFSANSLNIQLNMPSFSIADPRYNRPWDTTASDRPASDCPEGFCTNGGVCTPAALAAPGAPSSPTCLCPPGRSGIGMAQNGSMSIVQKLLNNDNLSIPTEQKLNYPEVI